MIINIGAGATVPLSLREREIEFMIQNALRSPTCVIGADVLNSQNHSVAAEAVVNAFEASKTGKVPVWEKVRVCEKYRCGVTYKCGVKY